MQRASLDRLRRTMMVAGDGEDPAGAIGGKERAIRALTGRGFREIGVDGSGLRLFKSASGASLIAIGSCRSLAYSRAGPGGRLQLVATARTLTLLSRISPETASRSNDPACQQQVSGGAPKAADLDPARRQVDPAPLARSAA
jgi:hypothetical protein